MLVIIDYGMGNLGSVKNMLKKIGVTCLITSDKSEIEKASKLLLPGVGSFDHAMRNLKELGLIDIIKSKVLEDKIPILGICLGMQLLTKGSDEGVLPGFEFVDGYASRFEFSNMSLSLPVPHMGWNTIEVQKASNLFQENNEEEERFYFVHSYAVQCEHKEDILSTTKYGYKFVSSFIKDNIVGCQFHPEKSHSFGMRLLKNFVENF